MTISIIFCSFCKSIIGIFNYSVFYFWYELKSISTCCWQISYRISSHHTTYKPYRLDRYQHSQHHYLSNTNHTHSIQINISYYIVLIHFLQILWALVIARSEVKRNDEAIQWFISDKMECFAFFVLSRTLSSYFHPTFLLFSTNNCKISCIIWKLTQNFDQFLRGSLISLHTDSSRSFLTNQGALLSLPAQ